MATFIPPKKGVQFIFYVGLVSQASAHSFQSNPTIAAGDFKVSIDGGALANPATLPAVTPASSKMVKITLSTSEMNGDNITVICSDAAGAEWDDLIINIQTAARQIDDLAFPLTTGRGTLIDVNGRIDLGSWIGVVPAVLNNQLVQADVQRVLNAVVNTALAQLGVNVVSQANIDFGALQKASLNAATPASIVGSVGSVTGAVTIVDGQILVKRNVALSDFPFTITSSVTHLPTAGLTVTGTRSIDGGAFAALANAVVEIGGGWYSIDFAASDLNGTTIAVQMEGAGADDRDFTIVTQE